MKKRKLSLIIILTILISVIVFGMVVIKDDQSLEKSKAKDSSNTKRL